LVVLLVRLFSTAMTPTGRWTFHNSINNLGFMSPCF
jgi:hypothetical protein